MATIKVQAARFADADDCLRAAEECVARERGLAGWDLAARWENEQREAIVIDVPAWAATPDELAGG